MNDHSFDMSFLPENPLSFFDLTADYNIRDLKRAYGRAIRQFRPESHAAEFQLIREAYLWLGQRLNDGGYIHSGFIPKITAPISGEGEPASKTTSSANHQIEAVPQSLDVFQLAILDPKSALKKIQENTGLSAVDYVDAALLAELDNDQGPHVFLEWLLNGLVKYPQNPTLYNLLFEYLSTDIRDEELGDVALKVAKKLRSHAFYSLTLPLWKRNFRRFPASKVIQELSECEANILLCPVTVSVAFDLQILPIAAWTVEDDWLQARLQSLDGNSVDFPEYLRDSYLQVCRTLAYVRLERQGMQGQRGGPHVEEARDRIRRWGLPQSPEDDEESGRFFVRMLGSKEELLKENWFRFIKSGKQEDSRSALFMSACDFIAKKIADDCEIVRLPAYSEKMESSVEQLLTDLNLSASRLLKVKRSIGYTEMGILCAGVAIVLSLTALFRDNREMSKAFEVVGLSSALIAAAYFFMVRPWIKSGTERLQVLLVAKYYQLFWRRRLFLFFQSSSMSVEQLIERLQLFGDSSVDPKAAQLLLEVLPCDEALHVYASAQRFRV